MDLGLPERKKPCLRVSEWTLHVHVKILPIPRSLRPVRQVRQVDLSFL